MNIIGKEGQRSQQGLCKGLTLIHKSYQESKYAVIGKYPKAKKGKRNFTKKRIKSTHKHTERSKIYFYHEK